MSMCSALRRFCSPILANFSLLAMKSKKLLLLVFVALCACNKPTPTVVLDGWWNADYAKTTCYQAKVWEQENAALISHVGCDKVMSCREMTPIVEACALDPVLEVRAFEDMIATEFASNPDCASISFVHLRGPNEMSKASSEALKNQNSWTLFLDYIPGMKQQQWSMIRSADRSRLVQGEGGPKEIASKACAIIKQRGATVIN